MADVVALNGNRPKWSGSLSEVQLRGAELMATGKYSQKQIAEQLKITEQTISRRWKHNSIFLRYVDYLTTQTTLDAALAVKGLTMQAIEVYSDLMTNGSDSIKLRVAQDVLNRAGIKDLKFDLLPKDGDGEDKKDVDAIKKRLLAIVESETADREFDEQLLNSMRSGGAPSEYDSEEELFSTEGGLGEEVEGDGVEGDDLDDEGGDGV
jgi:hypothetical protein